MGQKSKIEQYGLEPLVIEAWDGNKNTIREVTKKVNQYLDTQGYPIRVSREGIRRTIRSHKDRIDDAKKAVEISREMAEVLRDHPGTEAAEVVNMQLISLVSNALSDVEGIDFDDPKDLFTSAEKASNALLKLSSYRTKAAKAFEKAKLEIKQELKKAIQNDPELLTQLYTKLDAIEVA